ncbi:hypothetical protein SAMN05216411_1158 [Nitrosospira multiformis]|nr:hypothetical protein SAMN05216411_1158 [Nitrosospira multiformis]
MNLARKVLIHNLLNGSALASADQLGNHINNLHEMATNRASDGIPWLFTIKSM